MDLPPVLCPRLDAPIVLAHGLFGFDRIGVGPLVVASYFGGLPEYLEAAGNRVLVSQVPPIAGIERRAGVLRDRIIQQFGEGPVHLIGHSMGGLDARSLLAGEGSRGLVRSLTTIGTPHLGSALADSAKLGFGRFYRVLKALEIDHAGFLDTTRRTARRFHKAHPTPRDVPTFSVAGLPKDGDVCLPLQPLHALLEATEGPNDGVVSVESAEAFGEPLPRWPLDHLRQLGWFPQRPSISVLSLYLDILANLVGLGFAEPDV